MCKGNFHDGRDAKPDRLAFKCEGKKKKRVGVRCSGSRVVHTPETNVSSVPKINCFQFNSVKQSIAYQFYILNYEKE